MSGKVYIASMNMRGEWAPMPDGCKRVNVTSAQRKDGPFRLTFSPMTPIEGGYKGFYCFENYWQCGKRYEDTDTDKQIEWWKKQVKGKRRYPKGKGKQVLHAVFPHIDRALQYVESRKLVYVPEYFELIKDTQVFKNLKQQVELGKDIAVYDFDGVRTEDGKPSVQEISLELVQRKINDGKFPFGHGYIIAAALMGVEPSKYLFT